jgi:D-sedoheptulose 7-phosphate isomerase
LNAASLRSQLDETMGVARYLQTEIHHVQRVADTLIEVLRSGHRLLLCGNGGSALDAQHFAAELVGHYRTDRAPLPALALTADTGVITSIANDYAFDNVFARQVEALGASGDALIGISTSGNSKNVLAALAVGRGIGMLTVGIAGNNGGNMRGACDLELFLPCTDTARVQEGHLMLVHLLAECVDAAFATSEIDVKARRRA